MRSPSRALPALLGAAAAVLALLGPAALRSADAASDPARRSRECRAAIGQSAWDLTRTALRVVDVCHRRRDRGRLDVDCNALAAADVDGKLAAAERQAAARLAARCRPDDPVRALYPGGDVEGAVLALVRDAVAALSAELQGLPDLSHNPALRACHREIGEARRSIMRRILIKSVRCQKRRDGRAATFTGFDPGCTSTAGGATTSARRQVASGCGGVDGGAVGSCSGLPDCVVDAATRAGQALAARVYGSSVSVCGDGVRAQGEDCALLEGPPGEPALEALENRAPGRVPASEVETAADGSRVVRTRLEVAFVPGATVGQVNDLLGGIGGAIDAMLANVSVIVVRIPDPGSLAALDALVAALEADPRVRYVHREILPETQDLPANYASPGDDFSLLDLSRIDHHLAVRAHAAWNARGAIATRPLVVVQDFFGDGPPDAAVDYQIGPFADFLDGGAQEHGYHVLGILGAAFGGPAPCVASPPAPPLAAAGLRGCATGLYPGTVDLRVTDLAGNLGMGAADVATILQLESAAGPAVLNTSLGCPSCYGDVAATATRARAWIEKVRGSALEGRFLHATSAGNVLPTTPGITDSLTNSAYTGAALLPGLQEDDGTPVENLANVLAVENLIGVPTEPFAPLCLSPTSKFPGHVAGIGTDVFSLTDASGTAGDLTGTSMSTPQVAGLGAFLWSIDPSLTAQEVIAAVEGTALTFFGDGPGCSEVAPAPAIDAYAAVLSLDHPLLPTPATAPVRLALLDADGDGDFDQDDLSSFLPSYVDAFVDAGSHGPPVAPAERDYGRHDLNGDGFTGGGTKEIFDLDRVGSEHLGESHLGYVAASVEGEMRPFDEGALTDLEILCYYAYSALYTGDPGARAGLIDPAWCNPVVFEVLLADEVEPDEPTLLVVRVQRRAAGGSLEPLDGLPVEVDPSGGTVADFGGTTDGDGFFQTTAEVFPGQPELEVHVVVRTADGGPVLVERTVHATPTQLVVLPADVLLPAGAQQQFTAELSGAPIGDVTWNATGGTIDASGLFTAGTAQGVFAVTATRGGLFAAAVVEIVVPDVLPVSRISKAQGFKLTLMQYDADLAPTDLDLPEETRTIVDGGTETVAAREQSTFVVDDTGRVVEAWVGGAVSFEAIADGFVAVGGSPFADIEFTFDVTAGAVRIDVTGMLAVSSSGDCLGDPGGSRCNGATANYSFTPSIGCAEAALELPGASTGDKPVACAAVVGPGRYRLFSRAKADGKADGQLAMAASYDLTLTFSPVE